MLNIHPHKYIVSQSGSQTSQVTVCISLYNYQDYILETLESVREQTHDCLDLIIVEDQSTDYSLEIAREWINNNYSRFNQIYLVQHKENRGLSAARNTAISIAITPYIFILDSDNLIYPRCISRCIDALESDSEASVAYPIIEKFGGEESLMGNVVWQKEQFKQENCIDAMAMIRRQDLLLVGGYSELSAVGVLGWEDYELWCKFIDAGLYGIPVPDILAKYRTHETSMLKNISNRKGNIEQLHIEMMKLHPWLDLPLLS